MNKVKEVELNYSLTFALASFGATLMRLGLAFFIGASIALNSLGYKELSIIGIILIMVLDQYDGVLFRKSHLNATKYWRVNRRILDSVVDRIVIQVVCLPILITNHDFLPFYLIILLREISISGYATYHFTRNLLVYPGPIAKLACVLIGSIVISYFAFNSAATLLFLASMIIASILAFYEYRNTVINFRKYPKHIEIGSGCELINND